ncbi:hypothetical protein R3P38DRAFT_3105528, partial [Favolaschia claudopus]
MDTQEDQFYVSEDTKKCKKDNCNNRIPLSSPRVRCEHCRHINAQNQKACRARAAEAAQSQANQSKKRKRAACVGSDDRPPTRPRTDARGDEEEFSEPEDDTCGYDEDTPETVSAS